MLIYENELWIKDIDEVIAELPELSELAGKSVMITGATGLICSAVIDVLFRYNDTHDIPVKIIACGRSLKKMKARFGNMINRQDFKFVFYDASRTDNNLSDYCDYIIHGAGNAFPSKIVKEPVETMLGNFQGVKYLLDFAKKYGTKRLLYISSSEVYGKKEGSQPYQENEYGYIDLLNPRNSYSVGKRAAETLCVSFADEYDVDFVIVRPGHIYGPTASLQDNRVSSAWAFAAAHGENIVMKSDGNQLRSYCYCLDCASAILKVLVSGENAHAYNISNPDSIVSIKKMAELLVKAAGVKLVQEKATEDEKKGFNPMSNSSLDSTSLQRLGWKGIFGAERGFSHTVSILKETMIASTGGWICSPEEQRR